jgi:membrane protein
VLQDLLLILIWVYYSAIILYFGAEFTKVYANAHGNKIIPNGYAVAIRLKVVELKKNAKELKTSRAKRETIVT